MPTIDTIYVSGRTYETWSAELKLERQWDGEDLEIPSLFAPIDVKAIIEGQQKRNRQPPPTGPRLGNKKHKRLVLPPDTLKREVRPGIESPGRSDGVPEPEPPIKRAKTTGEMSLAQDGDSQHLRDEVVGLVHEIEDLHQLMTLKYQRFAQIAKVLLPSSQ